MSTQTYSCVVPQRRSKDHIHQLWVMAALFSAAAALSIWSTIKVAAYPVLPWVTGTLAFLSTAAAVLCLSVWVSVRGR